MEQYLNQVLDRVFEPVVVLSSEGKCLYYNRAVTSFLGLPPDDTSAEALYRVWPSIALLPLQAGESTLPIPRRHDEPLPVRVRTEALPGGNWLVRLLTDQELRRSLIDFHAERLQTLGMLAGGIAHDFNNILAGILGHTSYLKTVLPSGGSHTDSLRAVEDGAKKASVIIQQILNFSRLDAVEKIGACDLILIAQQTCALLRGAIPPDYELAVETPLAPVQVMGVEAKIAQIIVNLVVNARDALRAGGKITVKVGTGVPKTTGASESTMGKIEVHDDGCGMSSETLAHAFEPYFSTKKEKGTGLGLATVHAIVEFFGGSIDVASKVDAGTSFTIFLPLATGNRKSTIERSDEPKPVRSSRGERILIVDDETPVRQVLSLSLEHLGYEVELASSGLEALERFEGKGERFDLVILDMLMPNLSGEEVFFRLREIDPTLQVLIISGYSSEEAVQHILDQGGKGFIQKPFTIGELSRKVRRCLD